MLSAEPNTDYSRHHKNLMQWLFNIRTRHFDEKSHAREMLTEKNSLASKIPNHWKPEVWVDRYVCGEKQRDVKARARIYKF